MSKTRWMALALAAGLACGASSEASAGNASDDTVRAKLVETRNGYRVAFKFSELTENDRLTPPVLKRRLLRTRHSKGIAGLALRGGGRSGPLRVVVRLTDRFGDKVLADGRGITSFRYRIKDSCRKNRCGGPWGVADVTLKVASPN